MKVATAFFAMVNRRKAICVLFLLIYLISGCTVLHDSASFYQDQPRRPINWREYTSD
jgi:hypothetical protein